MINSRWLSSSTNFIILQYNRCKLWNKTFLKDPPPPPLNKRIKLNIQTSSTAFRNKIIFPSTSKQESGKISVLCNNFLLIANDTTILASVTGVVKGLALFKQLLTGNLLIKEKKKQAVSLDFNKAASLTAHTPGNWSTAQ